MLGYSDAEIDQMPVDVAHGLGAGGAADPNVDNGPIAELAPDVDQPVLQIEMRRTEPSS